MRIGLNTPDPQSISAEQATKSSTTATSQSDPTTASKASAFSQDKVTLSALATQALATPQVRQGLVDTLKQSVSSGQYQPEPHEIADAILGVNRVK